MYNNVVLDKYGKGRLEVWSVEPMVEPEERNGSLELPGLRVVGLHVPQDKIRYDGYAHQVRTP